MTRYSLASPLRTRARISASDCLTRVTVREWSRSPWTARLWRAGLTSPRGGRRCVIAANPCRWFSSNSTGGAPAHLWRCQAGRGVLSTVAGRSGPLLFPLTPSLENVRNPLNHQFAERAVILDRAHLQRLQHVLGHCDNHFSHRQLASFLCGRSSYPY